MKARSASKPESMEDPAKDKPNILHDAEKRAWLRLVRTPQIGAVTFWDLLSQFGSAQAALEALPEFARIGSRVSVRSIPSANTISAELDAASTAGLRLVATREPGYPTLLSHVEAPPPLLYIKGNDAVWNCPPVAIVGSRDASAAGLKLTAEIGAELGRAGFLIVSGLARGIDAAAHRASLPFGTCAVLAGGLNAIYPPEHAQLAAEIAQNGLLISECPPGFVARAQDFPRRNRIISGACLGVVVVEAAERSGSLITARLAGEQGREVFAVPGHPFESRAAGTNRLIREGAVLTSGARDVEEALRPLLAMFGSFASSTEVEKLGYSGDITHNTETTVANERTSDVQSDSSSSLPNGVDFLEETRQQVLKLLSYSPVHVDDICRLSGLETRHVHATLLALDLAGLIERQGGGRIVLKP
jgi:DNA processing protein